MHSQQNLKFTQDGFNMLVLKVDYIYSRIYHSKFIFPYIFVVRDGAVVRDTALQVGR
jgi:hypothetical protein